MRIWTALVVCGALTAGCTSAEDRIRFDGQFFNAKVRKVDRQADVFTVTVKGVSKSLEGAVLAGEYEAIKYCVNTFGTSDIIWVVGPQTPQAQLPVDRDVLTFQGSCPGSR